MCAKRRDRTSLSIFHVFILLYDNKFAQFIFTGSFFHIMLAHNVDFCKNFHHDFCKNDEKDNKTIFISFVENKSRGSMYLKC